MIPASLSRARGRRVKAEDTVTVAPVVRLMAAFGREEPIPVEGDPLPPLWHGLYCSASDALMLRTEERVQLKQDFKDLLPRIGRRSRAVYPERGTDRIKRRFLDRRKCPAR